MIKKIVFFGVSLVLLIYMVLPGPKNINQFANLPEAHKSGEPGDTVQIPNVAGFYSYNFRDFVTQFYQQQYKALTFLPFGPIKLNYPPEYAFTAIKDQTQSTYLEEYVYPLRDSLFVNGFEQFYEDGTPKFKGAVYFGIEGFHYPNKNVARLYPSTILVRVIVWLGINLSILGSYILAKRIIFND